MPARFRSSCARFLQQPLDEIIGVLATTSAKSGHAQHWHVQTIAWREQLHILRGAIAELIERWPSSGTWPILLEYEIPRRERRIDTVLLAGSVVVVVEFKVGASHHDAASVWQVLEYALDLRDFHAKSRGHSIVPVLVATKAKPSDTFPVCETPEPLPVVSPVQKIAPTQIAAAIVAAVKAAAGTANPVLDGDEWDQSPYLPALSIVEAATAVFAGHQVRELAHSAADDLAATTSEIVRVARLARLEGKRLLCVVTGIPGAGKTLAGLTAVHHPDLRRPDGSAAAVFLSGNGPLVRVVRTALARDVARLHGRRKEAARQVSTFVQNVHQFLGEYGVKHADRAPPEHVVVFDEAQRAWSAQQMDRKKGVARSEPAMMLNVMERCPGWSVVVAVVGGGQEIHTGEGGLSEWGKAIAERSAQWEVVASPEAISGGPSLAGQRLFEPAIGPAIPVTTSRHLHLRTNVRSFRAQVVGRWVNSVLEGDSVQARSLLSYMAEFPIAMTRHLSSARSWLFAHGGSETCAGAMGLVASSGALRHRAHGLELSSGFRRGYPFEEWFLASNRDIRASSRLEVAATEFECQGLELDWIGVCWGDDLVSDGGGGGWQTRRLVGSRWTAIGDPSARQLLLNKYRVLLTRARRGMIVWVPEGDPSDPTRDPDRLDRTAEFLKSCGIPEVAEPSDL